MKKTSTILKSLLLGALAVLMVTCGKTGGGGDYRNLIPDDALMTISINGQSIMDKAGFSAAERAALKGQAEMAFMFMGGMFTEDDKKFLLSIIDSPDNSGLSFKNDMYISVAMDNLERPDDVRAAFIAKISDKKKFDKLVNLLTKLEPSLAPKSDKGLNVITLAEAGSANILAYNDDAVIIFANEKGDYPSTINYVANLFKGDNSLLNNKDFAKFTDSKSDMGFLMNYGLVMDMVKNELPVGLPMLDALSAANIYMNTNFEKGKVVTEGGFIFTDKAAEKEYMAFYGDNAKLQGKFTKYLSDNAVFAFAGYLDGGKTYDMLAKFPQFATIAFIPQVKTIMEAFEGEMFMSVSNIWPPQLSGAVLATVNDKDILAYIVEQLRMVANVNSAGNGYYAVEVEGITVTLGIKDDVLFIGTDPEIIAALEGNSVNSPEKDIVNMFGKGTGAFYMDVENLSNSILDNYWYGGYMDQGTAAAIEFLGLFKDLRLHSQDNKEFTMTVTMSDEKKNAMASIADKIREIAMGAMF